MDKLKLNIMNKLKISTIVLSVFLLVSCNNKANEEATVATEPETYQHLDTQAIQLNDGKKWKVDDHMMVHFRNMEKAVSAADNENYQMLIDELASNINLLTSNCTMKGQGHDELHKWLLPFIENVKTFSNDKSNENFTIIQNSFTTFNQYFE